MNIQASESEDHGVAALSNSDLQVYSVGISTGGVAEIRMAEANPKRHIVATTIDEKGVAFAKEQIANRHLEGRIETKLEDVAQPLSYSDGYFDFVYARLVLHYLSEEKLKQALAELHRVLKPSGKLFVVVRSTKCPDATRKEARFDPVTHLTAGTVINDNGTVYSYSRYFHTEDSIKTYVQEAGFGVSYVKAYDEHLFGGFMRNKNSPNTDNVIELLATK
ncbi:MAG TPA: methyltransferase domain-containing protein [Candidatus Saccharimonadales bacterium]|nr:methyltransferase domain-containing protein [Candidatus Saccharimonadales bacterium]